MHTSHDPAHAARRASHAFEKAPRCPPDKTWGSRGGVDSLRSRILAGAGVLLPVSNRDVNQQDGL